MGDAGDSGGGGFGANATGIESIAAALQLFELCKPADSASIGVEGLRQVLRQHVGETHDVDEVLRPLRSETGHANGQVDFLSYWQCMDSFFREMSGGPGQLTEAAVRGEARDNIWGMRRFRDGVLELWRKGGKNVISSVELKALLSEIRDAAEEPGYWEEVMQALPCEQDAGLRLSEIAEEVCSWLRDVVREADEESEEEEEDADEPEVSARSEVASLKGFERGDNSPRFSLKSELRQAEKETYEAVPSPALQRSSTFAADDRSHHRDSLGAGPSSEILRAQELADLIRRAVDPSGDVPAQRALQKLNLAHDGIARQLHQQELELLELRRNNESNEKRMKHMEEELGQAQESQHELGDKNRLLDEYLRKASALEVEREELRHHLEDAQQEVQRLRDKVEEADQKVAEVKKRDWQLRDRIESLEELEANAEGQLKWTRSELDARSAELETAKRDLEALRAEKVKLNESLKDLKSSMGKMEQELQGSKVREEVRSKASAEEKRASLAAQHSVVALQADLAQARQELEELKSARSAPGSQELQHDLRAQLDVTKKELEGLREAEETLRMKLTAAEQEVCASAEVRRELAQAQQELAKREAERPIEGEAIAGEKLAALEGKVQLQQDQLKKLRAARDSMVSSQQDLPPEDEDLSPRQMMSDRQCRFLSSQLRVLLRHSQELEQLLDSTLDSKSGSEAEARRKQSLQRVHEEGKRLLDELCEKLYTLEVQKNDVDEELGRLQALVADLENQLAQVRRHRDELQRSSASSSIRPDAGLELGRKAFTASVTSDTRSRASVDSPMQKGTARTSSSDAFAFFGTSSRSPSELRCSPKANIVQGVVKVLSPSAFMMPDSDAKLVKQEAKQEKRKHLRQGQRHVRESAALNVRPSIHKRSEEPEEPAWRRRPSQAVRKSASADPQRFSAAKLAARDHRESVQQRMREMKQPDSECGTQ